MSRVHVVPASALPVDLQVLAALLGGDAIAVAEVLRDFRVCATQSQAALVTAVASDALPLAADAAHKLKSAARSIGAGRLGAICDAIEEMARGKERDELQTFLPQFQAELDAVCLFLAAHRT